MMTGIHLGWMSLLKINSNGKTKFTKIISKMEEQKLFISNFKVQSILFLKLFIKEKNDHNCHLASKLNNPETNPNTINTTNIQIQ